MFCLCTIAISDVYNTNTIVQLKKAPIYYLSRYTLQIIEQDSNLICNTVLFLFLSFHLFCSKYSVEDNGQEKMITSRVHTCESPNSVYWSAALYTFKGQLLRIG